MRVAQAASSPARTRRARRLGHRQLAAPLVRRQPTSPARPRSARRPRSDHGSDRGLGGVVLAPVDEHLPGSQLALHLADHQVRECPFQRLRQSPCVVRGLPARASTSAPALGRPAAGARRAACPSIRSSPVAAPARARRSIWRAISATSAHSSRPAGGPGSRSMTSRSGSSGSPDRRVDAPLRRMQFERSHLGQPHQRRGLADQRVVEVAVAAARPRSRVVDGHARHPLGRPRPAGSSRRTTFPRRRGATACA